MKIALKTIIINILHNNCLKTLEKLKNAHIKIV